MTRILTFVLFVFITLNTFSKPKDTKDYLRVVLKNLENVVYKSGIPRKHPLLS
jgi:hypothetical protein